MQGPSNNIHTRKHFLGRNLYIPACLITCLLSVNLFTVNYSGLFNTDVSYLYVVRFHKTTILSAPFNKNLLSSLHGMGAQIFQISKGHLKILGARTVKQSNFHTEDPQKLGYTIKIQLPDVRDLCIPVLWR